MLPDLIHAIQIARPFHTTGCVYEEKIDGWRMLALKEAGQVRLISRNGRDHTTKWCLGQPHQALALTTSICCGTGSGSRARSPDTEGWTRDFQSRGRSFDLSLLQQKLPRPDNTLAGIRVGVIPVVARARNNRNRRASFEVDLS
jgi:hypothetical protein